MYLIDTNVWLERLLDQERASEVKSFLDQTPSERLFITDFSFHSIGIVMKRLDQGEAFLRFVRDAFLEGAAILVALRPEDMSQLLQKMDQFDLDFDDAHQYIAAEKYDLILVSFDSDFDRTRRGCKTPAQVLKDQLSTEE
jgi:predicted nucleic acid-binding protein